MLAATGRRYTAYAAGYLRPTIIMNTRAFATRHAIFRRFRHYAVFDATLPLR